MIYEKPQIKFQKFHAESFLDNTNPLSAYDPTQGWDPFDWDEEGGFTPNGAQGLFNGTITINSEGPGGWLNG